MVVLDTGGDAGTPERPPPEADERVYGGGAGVDDTRRAGAERAGLPAGEGV